MTINEMNISNHKNQRVQRMVSEEFHNSMDLALYSLFKQGIIKVDYENNKLSINLEACGDTLEEAWTNLQMQCGMEPDMGAIENPWVV